MPDLRRLLEWRSAYPLGFSDDGETVLVGSNQTGTMQLFRLPREGGELEQLTDLDEPVRGQLVPGSGRILVSMDTGGNERTQLYLLDDALGAEPEPLVYEPDFLHVTPRLSVDGRRLAYASTRRNGVDFDIYVRELESGEEERCVFERGGLCEVCGFSPDGRWLGVAQLTEKSGDNELYLVDLESGEIRHVSPHDDESYYGEPAWLADATAFVCATSVGRDYVDLARYDLESGGWEWVLETRWDKLCWADPSGRHLLVEENADGCSRLELRDLGTLELRHEVDLPGRGIVAHYNPQTEPLFSRDGRYVAFYFASSVEAGDVWIHDTERRTTTRLTRSPGAVPHGELVEPELHRYESFDGESVPVFVYEPGGERPVPVLVIIHGGPEGQTRPLFNPIAQYFVGAGYAVVAPNVRGSTGYGKRYEHLDDVRLRFDSVRDLAELHRWLAEQRRFETGRVVLFGGSYGGYMVLAGLAFQPELWAAGIDIVGISSLVTFLENTSAYRRAFREREYGSLARDREFLERASPITHVNRIRAPLFIIHGRNDPRVPVGEAEQLHAALRERGIPCELLIYDDEGHGLQKLANRLDAYPRAVAFLDQHARRAAFT